MFIPQQMSPDSAEVAKYNLINGHSNGPVQSWQAANQQNGGLHSQINSQSEPHLLRIQPDSRSNVSITSDGQKSYTSRSSLPRKVTIVTAQIDIKELI